MDVQTQEGIGVRHRKTSGESQGKAKGQLTTPESMASRASFPKPILYISMYIYIYIYIIAYRIESILFYPSRSYFAVCISGYMESKHIVLYEHYTILCYVMVIIKHCAMFMLPYVPCFISCFSASLLSYIACSTILKIYYVSVTLHDVVLYYYVSSEYYSTIYYVINFICYNIK